MRRAQVVSCSVGGAADSRFDLHADLAELGAR
jgi:hypothetical protein